MKDRSPQGFWNVTNYAHRTATAKTVGELLDLLKDVPKNTRVAANGDHGVELTHVQLLDDDDKQIEGVCIE